MQCDRCGEMNCEQGQNCIEPEMGTVEAYSEKDREIHRAAALVEAEYYMQKTRVEELILFSREMGYERLGVAFCIGLKEETRVLCSYLRRYFKVYSICCKVCGIDKEELELPKIRADGPEAMCNPVVQARVLEENKTDLNITVGLCIGHDVLFNKHSQAPVTALIVKDRVLSHNPAGALYTGYYRKVLGQ